MKCNMLLPVILGLLLVLSGISWTYSAEVGEDVIFVAEPGQDGVYSELNGKIKNITSSEMIFEIGGKRLLYERDAVRRVILDPSNPENIQDLVSIYWNQEESQIVKAVQSTPIIGPSLSILDDLSGPVRMFLAVLVLLGLLLYATYKSYEIFVVTTNLRNLNIDKLNMEVRKLRYELNAIEEKVGAITKPVPEAAIIEEMEKVRFPYSFDMPQLHILDFVKYKIFRIFTEEEKKRHTESWLKKWQIHQDSSKFVRRLIYSSRLTLNVLSTFFVAVFSLGFFVDIMLPFIEPAEFSGASPLISLLFLILFIISFAFLLRLNAKRGIIRATYLETFSTRGASSIRATKEST